MAETAGCSYGKHCNKCPVVLEQCQNTGCTKYLHHMCQGDYMEKFNISLSGGDKKICYVCLLKMSNTSRQTNETPSPSNPLPIDVQTSTAQIRKKLKEY